MSRTCALCLGVLALTALMPLAAWSQEAPAPADPMAEALKTIRAAGTSTAGALDGARTYLVERRQQSLSAVAALLDDADFQVRTNAAQILCEMARAGDNSPALIQALQRCLKDRILSVVYWGVAGLMNDSIPAAEKRAALLQVLTVERPQTLRLALLPILAEKRAKVTVPLIINLLQNLLPEYKAQVETIMMSEQEAAELLGTAGTPPGSQPKAPAATAATPRPGTPGAGVPGQMLMRHMRQGLENMSLLQIQDLALAVERLPGVAEVHQTGMVLEEIVRSHYPEEKLFGFDSTAPWDLDRCVDKAVAWLNAHQAEFGAEGAPAPTTPAPKAPAAAPKGP